MHLPGLLALSPRRPRFRSSGNDFWNREKTVQAADITCARLVILG
jgi:hypothetical protein